MGATQIRRNQIFDTIVASDVDDVTKKEFTKVRITIDDPFPRLSLFKDFSRR